MLIRRAAMVLRVEAILLFLLAVVLIGKPEWVAHYLDISKSRMPAELLWVLKVLGATFLIPALLAPLVAAFAGERGLRQAASGMAFISLVVGTVCLLTPGGVKVSSVLTSLAWYVFALLYFFALRGRGRNR